MVNFPPITEIMRAAPSSAWSCKKCRRVTADGLLSGVYGSGRTPANAYLMSCADILDFGNNCTTARNRYSISSAEGVVLLGSPLSGTSVVPTIICSFQGKTKTGRPSVASLYRAAFGAAANRGRIMCDPRTPPTMGFAMRNEDR